MYKKTDPYSFTKYCTLLDGANEIIGNISLDYQVTLYDDVQIHDRRAVRQQHQRQFMLTCTQRFNIWNEEGKMINPNQNLSSYDNYPVLVNTLMSLNNAVGLDWQLLDYSPRTVNTAVQTSGSSGSSAGATTGISSSSSVGSSYSETNSFGVSANVGFMGDVATGSVTSSAEHSSTHTSDQSSTSGRDASKNRNTESSSSDSMSIKDWGSYALVNPATKNPAWTFGQEYPWDAITCRKTNGTEYVNNPQQVLLNIPTSMSTPLYDGVSLYPPSELSMFGVNFVMKATWRVYVHDHADDEVMLSHIVNYMSGSHQINPAFPGTDPDATVAPSLVYIDQQATELSVLPDESLSTRLNLNLMALDPLGVQGGNAIVGFLPKKFMIKPIPAQSSTIPPVSFKIISTTNDLMMQDVSHYATGHDAGCGFSTSQTALSAHFTEHCTELQLMMYFKVIDSIQDYTLYLKHWKTAASGVMLTFIINEDVGNPITKYVDALEAEGGEKNLLAISLRNLDFASVDYFDYLQLGLNSIRVILAPIDGNYSASGYQLRAVSIGSA